MANHIISNQEVSLDDLKSFISCSICEGVLIDPQTISECMHTCKPYNVSWIENNQIYLLSVCKRCIIDYCENSIENTCPKCHVKVALNPEKAFSNDEFLANSLQFFIPQKEEKEKLLKSQFDELFDFEKSVNLSEPLEVGNNENIETLQETIGIQFQEDEESTGKLGHFFLSCPANATINQLKEGISNMLILHGEPDDKVIPDQVCIEIVF